MTSFEEFLDYCITLRGTLLYTERKCRPFTVTVEGSAIRFTPSSGSPRTANPEYTGKVLDLLIKTRDWSPARYNHITYHSSYILGIAKHWENTNNAQVGLQGRHTNDNCEIWGQSRWRRVSVAFALARPSAVTRCIECHGAVRLHRAGPSGVPRSHAEHRERHPGCSLGHYFSGTRSTHPNQVLNPIAAYSHSSDQSLIAVEDDESAFPEGSPRYALHRKLERDGGLPRRVKAARLAVMGKLECEACGFDFVSVFGELGVGFIEAHHRVPIHRLDGNSRTKAEELALVCSNCHRMLHRSDPHMSVEELSNLLTARRSGNSD